MVSLFETPVRVPKSRKRVNAKISFHYFSRWKKVKAYRWSIFDLRWNCRCRSVNVTFGIEKPRNAVLALGDVKDLVEPFAGLVGSGRPPVDEIGTISVEQGAERQAVPPRAGEVRHTDSWVTCGRTPGPSQQCFAGGYVRLLADNDIGYLEMKKVKLRILWYKKKENVDHIF